MCTKDVFHAWNKEMLNVDYQSIRVSILNIYFWFLKK